MITSIEMGTFGGSLIMNTYKYNSYYLTDMATLALLTENPPPCVSSSISWSVASGPRYLSGMLLLFWELL